MNPRHVDTTTFYGMVRTFECGQPAKCNPWPLQNLIDVTADLLVTRQITRSFVPGAAGQEDPRIAAVLKTVGAHNDLPTRVERNDALLLTRGWVRHDTKTIQTRFQNIVDDHIVAADWTDWHVKHEWTWRRNHRKLSLMDKTFPKEVATIVHSDIATGQYMCQQVEKMCKDDAKFESLVQGSDPDLGTAKKVFWASLLVRGGYYTFLAKEQRNCMQHPVRGDLVPNAFIDTSTRSHHTPSWPDFLAAILAVLSQRKNSFSERLGEWHDLVSRAKRAVRPTDKYNFENASDVEDVKDAVVKFAREKVGVTNEGTWDEIVGETAAVILDCVVERFTFGVGKPWAKKLKLKSAKFLRKIRTRPEELRKMIEHPNVFEIRRGRAIAVE